MDTLCIARKTVLTPLLLTMSLLAVPLCLFAQTGQQETGKPGETKPDPAKSAAPKPGRDRWLVKTASDPDATSINKRPVKSTVEKLLSIARPKDFPMDKTNEKYQEHRAKPVETTVYTVEADVVEYRLMPDGDYRVTIRGASGQTMVLEMPDPDPKFVDPQSPFAYAIKAARGQFEEKFKPERTARTALAHVRITGIGYFGRAFTRPGTQPGTAPATQPGVQPTTPKVEGNLIQLHPVLDVQWMDKPTPEFIAPKLKEEKTNP